jgi:hypothetical protein
MFEMGSMTLAVRLYQIQMQQGEIFQIVSHQADGIDVLSLFQECRDFQAIIRGMRRFAIGQTINVKCSLDGIRCSMRQRCEQVLTAMADARAFMIGDDDQQVVGSNVFHLVPAGADQHAMEWLVTHQFVQCVDVRSHTYAITCKGSARLHFVCSLSNPLRVFQWREQVAVQDCVRIQSLMRTCHCQP